MNVEFECVVCGDTAVATVDKEDVPAGDDPLKTLRECPHCGMETIWIEA
ncbi:hypothetical protein GRX03_05060 [Halovenus sp. WSH3]|uniref:Uncharacterized protein n=1 Tax=Halovenus carboxidivorans TaxID=2692199 RepID=A0A6B0SYV3_9EURY|nr:hypothetical protein [Halovenus carboxidivorans]MXR50978.1 hypothetical protein [Halovenus carboxidivorans]